MVRDPEDNKARRAVSWQALLGAGADPWGTAKEWAPNVVIPAAALGALRLYTIYLRRIPGSAYIRPSFFRSRTLSGRVTSVGDGDNFHLFHTPGGRWAGWGWLRRVPTERAELRNRTIHIRLAGIDAPEGAHFGRPAQPYSAEAMDWLTRYVLHRPVRARIWKRDHYDRIVATAYRRRWLVFRRDIGLEMIRAGWALTYEAKTGAEFGGLEAQYRAAEASARRARLGMWAGGRKKGFESPGAYKARWKAAEKG